MKLSVLPLLFAGAGLVSALPMRLIVVTSIHSEASPIRFGHAMANSGPFPQIAHRPCGKGMRNAGGMMRAKALEMSNAFRQALGMPPIEMHHNFHHGHHHKEQANGAAVVESSGGMHMPPHRMGRFQNKPFMVRVSRALMSLGPWEGRAIAFVIGCGLGVLLRMFWVLVVVMYRVVRHGTTENQDNEYVEVDVSDAELIFVAPPQYTYADEKETVKVVEPATQQ